MADAGVPFTGLGYGPAAHAPTSSVSENIPDNSKMEESAADLLMRRYMDQCLAYHEEQVTKEAEKTVDYAARVGGDGGEASHFLPASAPDAPPESRKNHYDLPPMPQPPPPQLVASAPPPTHHQQRQPQAHLAPPPPLPPHLQTANWASPPPAAPHQHPPLLHPSAPPPVNPPHGPPPPLVHPQPSGPLPPPPTASLPPAPPALLPPAAPAVPVSGGPPGEETAAERARAIALKFHAQHRTDASAAVPAAVDVPPTPSQHAAQRSEHFRRERSKLQTFLLKNFEYVAKKDELRLKLHMEEMERVNRRNEVASRGERSAFERRRDAILAAHGAGGRGSSVGGGAEAAASSGRKSQSVDATSKSGIGTSRRSKIESKKRKDGNRARTDQLNRCSVYVSGLPTDGSFVETNLRGLFESYGRIERCAMYREKAGARDQNGDGGRLKGDAIVVYDVGSKGDARALEDAVCSQLNGAELPCGSTIAVQPADPDYKEKKKNSPEPTLLSKGEVFSGLAATKTVQGGKGTAVTSSGGSKATVGPAVKESTTTNDDDLDDFFASLE